MLHYAAHAQTLAAFKTLYTTSLIFTKKKWNIFHFFNILPARDIPPTRPCRKIPCMCLYTLACTLRAECYEKKHALSK